MRARPFVQVYPTSQLNGWAYLTDAVAPPILRGCHGDERKIVEIYECDCDTRQSARPCCDACREGGYAPCVATTDRGLPRVIEVDEQDTDTDACDPAREIPTGEGVRV